ncbi:MAG: ABC transporter ATP-binding protein, partial [Clostridia bacterium]|nr:ABC transporter ATP-binding protein [Clostridia bacterium]
MKKKNIFNNFSQKHRKFILGGHTLTLFAVLFLLILPQITQLFIDSVYSSSGTKEANFGVLWGLLTNGQVLDLGQIVLWLSISFVLVAILKNVCTFFASQCYFLGASRSRSALRRACFKKLSFLDNSISVKQTFFNFTSDVTDFSDIFYRHRPKMFDSLTKIVIAGLLCILIDKQIALGFLILVPIVFLVGVTLEKKLVEKHSEARNRKSIMFGASEDLIENIKEIKTFGAEDWAIEKYS